MDQPNTPQIIWTRGEDCWAKDRTLFAKDEAILPLAATRWQPLAYELNQELAQSYMAATFTSVRAVRVAWENPVVRTMLADMAHIYTFGKATALALQEYDLAPVLVDCDSGAELAEYVSQQLPQQAPVAVFQAARPASDIADIMRQRGIKGDAFSIYATEEGLWHQGAPVDQTDFESLVLTKRGVICFASPSAVRGFLSVAQDHLNLINERYVVTAIGNTTKSACDDFVHVQVAKDHSLSSLIQLAEGLI